METAFLVLITSVLGGGVTGAVVVTWGLALRVYRLERAVSIMQADIVSETKKRAALSRPARDPIDAEVSKLQKELFAGRGTLPASPGERFANDADIFERR